MIASAVTTPSLEIGEKRGSNHHAIGRVVLGNPRSAPSGPSDRRRDGDVRGWPGGDARVGSSAHSVGRQVAVRVPPDHEFSRKSKNSTPPSTHAISEAGATPSDSACGRMSRNTTASIAPTANATQRSIEVSRA